MMQAYGGLMSVIGDAAGPPMRVGNIVSDMLAGTNAFSGVLLALLRRGATGVGGRVEVSLLDSLVAFQATGLTEFLVTGTVPPRPGNRHPLIGASGVTLARDGYLAVGVLDHCWQAFCGVMGLEAEERFATAALRQEHQDALWQKLDALFAERSVQEWCDLLTPVGVVAAAVHDYADVTADAQVKHNQLIGSSEGLPMIRNALRLDGVAPLYGRPPSHGEHSADVDALWS
jgi:crotonobetainyl-CoA:carnitine CoA-transferase CaiB-like acyl-CoA transferase